MALTMNQLWVVHSGGATNFDPAADLGGAISVHASKRVVSQLASALSQVTGVTIDDAYGNPEGVGSLSYSAGQLGWKPYGMSTYYGVNVSLGGTFLIGSSSGYLVVTVNAGGLPGAAKIDSVTISNNQQNVFPNVSAANSLLGITEYRCHYILNTSGADTATDVRLWIQTNTPGGDNIAIGLDPAGKNGTATTSSNGGLGVPAGVTFSQPTSYGGALTLGNLIPGDRYAFWQRRTVPPETRGTVISNGAVIAIAATI